MKHTQQHFFNATFLITGLLVQVITYIITPSTPLSLISGLFGICSVVLCSQGSILTFFFGFGQILTYTYLCYLERFYAGIAMNAFYFLSQIYGIFSWRKRLTAHHLQTRSMPAQLFVLLTLALVALSAATGFLLDRFTDDTQPYFDAFTTVPAIAAQLLMVTAYKQQWYIWLAIDMLYVCMWTQAGNACMTAQYAFWCANCIYGLIIWNKYAKKD